MPSIEIDADEWYPVYSFNEESQYGYELVAISDADLARLKAAFAEFEWAQGFLNDVRPRRG